MSAKAKLLSFTAILSMTVSAPALAGPGFAPGPAGLNYYSYQNILIGATQTLQSSANYGAGVTVATIDTGITKDWVGFGGLTINSTTCLNSVCHATVNNSDDHGHGTFVASEIIGGVQFGNGNGQLGVAPLANLNAIKVLDANGSGNTTDIINGIRYAADSGAKVINISLGPTGTTASQISSFYNAIAPALSYATSKNAVIIFAGGNSNMAFDNNWYMGASNTLSSNLFTNDMLHKILFVGATDSNKVKTTYTNTPGAGGIYTTTGSFFSYSNLWVMADGGGIANGACVDCIVGAPNVAGSTNYLALMAGTSMAAPEVTGASALLAARWPQLLTQGTLTSLLRTTATDLGARGVDSTYGYGFINLTAAFQPVGGLSVQTGSGNVSVTKGGAIVSGGALGTMSKLTNALSNVTAIDGYNRDFQVNLSGLVSSRTSSSPATTSMSAPKVSSTSTHFANGSSFAYASFTNENPVADRPSRDANQKSWTVAFTDASGSTMSAGNGFPAASSFADAFYGNDSLASGAMTTVGASSALLGLAEGGSFVSYGTNLDKNTRVAFSWTQTDPNPTSDWTKPDATSFNTGLNLTVADGWKAGVTFGLLDETSGLLGTTYATHGPISFGQQNRSSSMGVTSSFDLGDKRSLLVDAAIVRSNTAEASGIITSVAPLYARTFGAALVQDDAILKGDHASFSLRSPLRVYSGSATLATNSVDSNGNIATGSQRVSLTPSGNEFDLAVGYAAPITEKLTVNATIDARRNADNVDGENDADFLLGMKLRF